MKSVILGAGGHARELQSVAWNLPETLGLEDEIPDYADIIIGLGDIAGRKRLYEEHVNSRNIIGARASASPAVWQTSNYKGGHALQLMRGVMLCNNVLFGVNVLVNTGAQIDHDCIIGDHCVISPGAILCGNVTLGAECFIGAGAIIVQGVTLEPGTFVKAGTLAVGQDDMREPQRLLSTGELEVALLPLHPTGAGTIQSAD